MIRVVSALVFAGLATACSTVSEQEVTTADTILLYDTAALCAAGELSDPDVCATATMVTRADAVARRPVLGSVFAGRLPRLF
ncbi:MAG: hypothetical protein AAGE76_13040 [Pseudomonadota bacterium]